MSRLMGCLNARLSGSRIIKAIHPPQPIRFLVNATTIILSGGFISGRCGPFGISDCIKDKSYKPLSSPFPYLFITAVIWTSG